MLQLWLRNQVLRKCLITRNTTKVLFTTYKHFSANSEKLKQLNSQSENDFFIFYKLPKIILASVLAKLKWYQTGSLFVFAPLSYGLEFATLVPADTGFVVSSIGLLATLALHTLGILFYNLVGALYLHSDGETVKISHLDYLGRRIDIICPKDDIIPFSDFGDNVNDPFVFIRRYTDSQKLRLSLRFGKVIDDERFKIVFSNL